MDKIRDATGRVHIWNTKFLIDLLAGGGSAAIAVSIMAPVERIKIILQVQHTNAGNMATLEKYTGLLNALKRIPKEEGFFSLWRGNVASVLRTFPYQALNFALKEKFKITFHAKEEANIYKRFMWNLLSGGIAGSTSMTLIYPLDYARTRMAADFGNKNEREFKSLRDVMLRTYRADGLLGIYNGLSFSIVGVFIYRAAYFGLFDTGSELLPKELRHNFFVTFLVAEFAATTSGFVSYPFDTVRRVMMLQAGKPQELRKYKSSWDCSYSIFKEQGIKGFFRGSMSNIVRGTGGALMLVLFDEIQYQIFKGSDVPFSMETSVMPGRTLSPNDIKNITKIEGKPAETEEIAPIKHLLTDFDVETSKPEPKKEPSLSNLLSPSLIIPTEKEKAKVKAQKSELKLEEEKIEEEEEESAQAVGDFFAIPGIPPKHQGIHSIMDEKHAHEKKEARAKKEKEKSSKSKPPSKPPPSSGGNVPTKSSSQKSSSKDSSGKTSKSSSVRQNLGSETRGQVDVKVVDANKSKSKSSILSKAENVIENSIVSSNYAVKPSHHSLEHKSEQFESEESEQLRSDENPDSRIGNLLGNRKRTIRHRHEYGLSNL